MMEVDKNCSSALTESHQVLCEYWEYQTNDCISCRWKKKHTLVEHTENVEKYAMALQLIKNIPNKDGKLFKPLWNPDVQHCPLCYAYKPHTASEHIQMSKKSKDTSELKKPNWNVLSSKKCWKCKHEIPHTNESHYKIVEHYEKGMKKDTSSGQIDENSILFSESDKPVVSTIRPFTWADRVEVEKRKLSSTLKTQINAYSITNTPNSEGTDDPAKAPGYVSDDGNNTPKQWWEDQQPITERFVYSVDESTGEHIYKLKQEWLHNYYANSFGNMIIMKGSKS